MRSKRQVTIVGLLLALAVLIAGVLVVQRAFFDDDLSDLGQAVEWAPVDAQRLNWTDWSAVRSAVDSSVTSGSTWEETSAFLDTAFSRDLTSTSALPESAQVLHEQYGFSPASIEWELFSQSEAGASLMMKLDPDALADLPTTLENLGYTDAGDGRWTGSGDLLARIGQVTPELTYVAIDEERELVLASDASDGVDLALEGLDDDAAPDLGSVPDSLAGALNATLYTGAHACVALSMGNADAEEQATGAALLQEAGKVNPLQAFGIGQLGDDAVRVAMGFETEDQARTNADSRAQLASGPAPGQGGSFAERFALGEVVADGDLLTMDLDPVDGAYVLSDLSNGPVLFATC